MRFKLTDQLLLVAVVAVAAFLAREGVELRQRGFELSEIAIVVGTTVCLDVVACWAAIALWRRLKALTKSRVR
jgi:hypothetical protein